MSRLTAGTRQRQLSLLSGASFYLKMDKSPKPDGQSLGSDRFNEKLSHHFVKCGKRPWVYESYNSSRRLRPCYLFY